jgi:hypothetical protein
MSWSRACPGATSLMMMRVPFGIEARGTFRLKGGVLAFVGRVVNQNLRRGTPVHSAINGPRRLRARAEKNQMRQAMTEKRSTAASH